MELVVAAVKVVVGIVQYVATAGSWQAMLLRYVAVTAGTHAISRAVAKKPSIPSLRSLGTEVNVRDPAAPRQIIYGQRRVSGVLYPVGTSGTNNEFLHLILLVAGHECEELGDITFNDEVVPLDGSGNATGRYAGYVTVKKHAGAYDQTVDTALQTALGSSYWSNDHKLQGIAYLYIRLKVSADLFPGGIPEIYCLVKGRKLYDPRDGDQDPADPSTWVWSDNAALCLADWLRGVPTQNGAGTLVRNHGVGAADDEIDWDDVATAANICDEEVELADETTEARYTCNGVMHTSTLPDDGIEILKAAMAGDCVYVGGKWVVLAGAYRTPTLPAFTDSDLRAPLQGVRLKPASTELYNVGRGLYISADNNWQPTDLPQVTNSTYKTQDGGIDLPLDMEFHFTTSNATGQRLLKIAVERSRQGISFVARCKLGALQVRTGDVILWTDSDFGWTDKPFEVLATALVTENDANGQPYLGVDLTLKETASAVWDWNDGEETTVDPAPNTSLRSPFDIEDPTSLSVSNSVAQQEDGTAVPRLHVSWTAPADANVTTRGHIRVEYKLTAASDWLPVAVVRGDITEVYITAVVIGQSYDVRIRSENDIYPSPNWVTDTGTTVTGDTNAPDAPTGLTATVGTGKSVSLDWSDNTETDLSEYAVYRHTSNVPASATKIAEIKASRFVDVDVSLGTQYYYWVTAIDTSENESSKSSGVNATPTTVASGSVDSTVPDTPSAPTYVSEATYLSGDGTVFARVTIDLPSLPTGARVLQALYRRDGASGWLIADEKDATALASSDDVTIDDLSPGQDYEFACRAISFSNVPSAVSSTLSRTAPNHSTGPGAPGGPTYLAGDDVSAGISPQFYNGILQYSMLASWTRPSSAPQVAYYEWRLNQTNSSSGTAWLTGTTNELKVVMSFTLPVTSYFFVRAIDRTGNAGTWAGGSTNVSSYFQPPAGNMSNQNSDAVEVSGIQTGSASASSVRQVLAVYEHGSHVESFTGGSPSETFSLDITGRGFSARPDVGYIQCEHTGFDAYYIGDLPSTSTSAVFNVFSRDGSNIPNGANLSFHIELVEYN